MESTSFYTILLSSLAIGGAIAAAVRVAQVSRSNAARQERILSELLKYHTDMVVVTDGGGLIVSASDRFNEAMRRASTNKPAVSFPELFQTGHRQSYEKILKYLHREKKPLIDHKAELTWGTLGRKLDLTVVPILDSSGHIFALIHILRPPKDRGEVASDLGHIEKLTNIGQIAAGMAHELNTPLGSIILATDIIAEQLPASGSVTEEVTRIRAQADHCSKVVKQLLGYVRKDEQTRSVHNVKEVIEIVLDLVAAEAIKQGITINLESGPDKPEILCNENQVKQLFFNLLSNAFHAVGADGRIVIQIGHDPLLKQVTVSIADNGVGIPPEQVNKIFDPFFTTRSSKEGTGLGLALCKKIMAEHSGRITVESKIGDGATFMLYFPTIQ